MSLPSRPRAIARLAAAAGLTVLFACGGGGSSNTANPQGPPQVQLDLTPSIDSAHANWVAYQDGDGPWVPLSGSNGHYVFKVANAAGRYGLAYVTWTASGFGGRILMATTADGTAFDFRDPVVTPTFTVSGSLDYGVTDNSYGIYMDFDSTGGGGGNGPIPFALRVRKGLKDMVVVRQRPGQQAEGAAIQRGIDVEGDMTHNPPGSGAEFPLSRATITIGNLPTGQAVQLYAFYQTQNKTQFEPGSTYGTNATQWVSTVPAAQQVAGEYHFLEADLADGRTAWQAVKNPTSVALNLSGPMAAAVTTIPVSSPYARPHSVWTPPAGTQATRLEYSGVTGSWQVDLSAAWLAGGTTYAFPDFGTTTGWLNGWGLEPTWTPGGTMLVAFQTNVANPFLLFENLNPRDSVGSLQDGMTVLLNSAQDNSPTVVVPPAKVMSAVAQPHRSRTLDVLRSRPGRFSRD